MLTGRKPIDMQMILSCKSKNLSDIKVLLFCKTLTICVSYSILVSNLAILYQQT